MTPITILTPPLLVRTRTSSQGFLFLERAGPEAAERAGGGPGGPLPEELSRPRGLGRHGGHADGPRQ